jgi:hypothetical protein
MIPFYKTIVLILICAYTGRALIESLRAPQIKMTALTVALYPKDGEKLHEIIFASQLD